MRRRREAQGVELNVAAMLDMAFQLLAFFILTFRPSPIEGQLSLRLPPAQPVTNVQSMTPAGSSAKNLDPAAGLNTLVISVFPNERGFIGSMGVGEVKVVDLVGLDTRLKAVFADKDVSFDQVIVQVGATLRYEELMKVMEVCSRQTLRNGRKLSRLSFVELPSAGGPNKQ
jgi:biopolymer transport protein ExbD